MRIKNTLITFQSSLLLFAVLLNGAHAKDLAKPHFGKTGDSVKIHADDVMAKATADLHNHIDKQTVKSPHIAHDNQPADGRSLRLLKEAHTIKHNLRMEYQLTFQLWFHLLAAKLSL